MQKFIQYTPTEILFGENAQAEVGKEVKKWGGSRVFIVYGGGSVKKSGLLAQVEEALEKEGLAYEEFGGVKPNPRMAYAQEGVEKAIEFGADFLLAVGGGSSIDTAKAIAHGVANPDWSLEEIWGGEIILTRSTPVGCVLTIAAAGSETSDSAVLTNEETGKKGGISTGLNRPKFAIMNPVLTYTLPKYQIACGVVDIMMHTLERYFSTDGEAPLTDRLAEGLLKEVIAEGVLRVVIENGKKGLENPTDYDAMSEIMWAGSLSHNGLTGLGRAKDFSVHKLGHALGAKYDKAHGATLSAVWGSWAEYVYKNDEERFAHYAKKVWGVEEEDVAKAAKEGIRRTVEYFREIHMPTNLKELEIGEVSEEDLRELAMAATLNDTVKLSKIKELTAEDVYQIFRKAAEK